MRFVSALACTVLLASIAAAQTPITLHPIDETEARKNLIAHPEPVYPPIARAAQVQGDVLIAAVIDPNGKVTSEKILSGPPMLQQAALDAVRQWTFKPFELNGAATAVTTTFKIAFQIYKPGEGPSAAQEKAAQAWFPLADKCRTALRGQNKEDAVNYCKQALDMSMQAGDITSSDQLGRMNSYQYYGHALLLLGRFQEALDQENKAIDEAKKCLTDTDQEYAMPFFWRAMAEANLGQVDATLADLQTAEAVHRQAIIHLPEMKKIYSQYLASILRQHAALLDQLGRTDEANKLRTEAASL